MPTGELRLIILEAVTLVTGILVTGILVTGISFLGPGALAAAQTPHDSIPLVERLDRIRSFLEEGTPKQRAAAQRQLREQVDLEDLVDFRAYLTRRLPPDTLRSLSHHLALLLTQRILRAESRVTGFESARRMAREQARRILDASDPESQRQLAETRETREQERALAHKEFQFLLKQGLALAPALWMRRQQGAVTSVGIQKFHSKLMEGLVDLASRLYPSAPQRESISPFERRALVPLVAELESPDSEGWNQFREEIAREALALFESYRPDERREARRIFLQLGKWGTDRLDRWQLEKSQIPAFLRQTYAEWNRLSVPVGFTNRNSLDLARYRFLPAVARQEMIYRIEWVGGENGIPILVSLLDWEPDLSLKVEVAAALARLSDPRGAAFLRRLGLEQIVELEAVSRKVLLIEAIHRRESGDLEGAIEEFKSILGRFPGDFRIHYALAYTALLAKRHELAIRHFKLALGYKPDDHLTHYNLACAYAVNDQRQEAMRALEAAVGSGFNDVQHIENDPDLESLRSLPSYLELLKRLRGG